MKHNDSKTAQRKRLVAKLEHRTGYTPKEVREIMARPVVPPTSPTLNAVRNAT